MTNCPLEDAIDELRRHLGHGMNAALKLIVKNALQTIDRARPTARSCNACGLDHHTPCEQPVTTQSRRGRRVQIRKRAVTVRGPWAPIELALRRFSVHRHTARLKGAAVCAFCGALQAKAAMDMTGHGWRCVSCAAQSELNKARGGSDMADHLTQPELRAIVVAGGSLACGGGALVVLGILLTALSLSLGGQVVVVFVGLMARGLGMLGHGLHRRNTASQALQQFPTATVFGRRRRRPAQLLLSSSSG